jgi:hypothetical protein
MPLYSPQDPFPYSPDPLSRIADGALPDGLYAYEQDTNGNVWALPDQPHVHPKILGLGKSVLYAGDLHIQGGEVVDITNLSGTFQCDDPAGLVLVADQLGRQGMTIRAAAVRFFPADGSPPRVLR